jgi:hypothetical protein
MAMAKCLTSQAQERVWEPSTLGCPCSCVLNICGMSLSQGINSGWHIDTNTEDHLLVRHRERHLENSNGPDPGACHGGCPSQMLYAQVGSLNEP